MSYTIYYSDPAKFSYPIVVQDNTKYNGVGTGGLTLVGRNYPAYGQAVAEDLIHILENSASTVPPINPIEGQLWYDSRTKKLRINDGAASNANWKPVNGIFQQETEPTNVIIGDIWVDTINFQVKVWTGTEFKLVGPSDSGASQTGAIPVTDLQGTDNQTHSVILNYVAGTIVSVIAKEAFIPLGGNPYNLTASLVAGVNLVSSSYSFNGIADSANYLRQNGEKIIGSSFMRKDISQSLNGRLTIANDSNALQIGTDPTFIIERLNSGAVANFVNTYNANGRFSFNIKNANFANVEILRMGDAAGRVEIFSTNTSALVVAGGATFGNDISLGGNLTFTSAASTLTVSNIVLTSSTQATSISAGSLVVAGGVAVGKNLHVGGDFYAYTRFFANSTLGGVSTGTSGQVLVAGDNGYAYWRSISTSSYQGGAIPGGIVVGENANATSSSDTNASIYTAGGVAVVKDVYIGGGVTATSVTIDSTIITTSSIATSVTIRSTNTASSTSTITGALVIAGGVGIGGDLYVGGNIYGSKLTIDETVINSTVVQTGDQFTITNTTNASSTITGALRVAGGAGIGGNVYAGALYDASRRVVTTLVDGTGTQAVRSGLTTATMNLLPPTTSVIGGVKTETGTAGSVYVWSGSTGTLTTGTTINIDSNGVIAVNTNTLMTTSTFARFVSTPATVSGTYLGGVRAGGKYIDVSLLNGQMSVLLTPGTGIGITESPASGNAGISGAITLNTATSIARGGVIVPEYATSYIYLSANGSIRVDPPYQLPAATTSTLGGVKIGANINVTPDGTISITPGAYTLTTATSVSLGGVKIGTGISAAGDGTISVNTGTPYVLPTASSTILGGIKIGDGLAISGTGTVSVSAAYTLLASTTATLGGIIGLVDTQIALGSLAGYTQGTYSIAIGNAAGAVQGADAIAIGDFAGNDSQGNNAIAIGPEAGKTTQGTSTVAVGFSAGNITQNRYAVAIGRAAGLVNQGEFAVAIGAFAGDTNQPASSIIINATGTIINAANTGTYINPIRSASTTSNVLYYNSTTKEVTYGPEWNGGTVSGITIFTSALTANSTFGVRGNFNVTGTTTISTLGASNGVFSGNLGVTGTVTIVGATTVSNTTNATSTITGALRISGGVGIGRDLFVGGYSVLQSITTGTVSTLGTGTPTGATVYFTDLVPKKIGVYDGASWTDALGTVLL